MVVVVVTVFFKSAECNIQTMAIKFVTGIEPNLESSRCIWFTESCSSRSVVFEQPDSVLQLASVCPTVGFP